MNIRDIAENLPLMGKLGFASFRSNRYNDSQTLGREYESTIEGYINRAIAERDEEGIERLKMIVDKLLTPREFY